MSTRGLLLALLCPASLAGQASPTGRLAGTLRGINVPVDGSVAYLVPTQPAGAAGPQDTVVVDQLNLSFVPRLIVVLPGTVVDFQNSDPVLHNVFSPNTPPFNLGLYPRTTSRQHRFSEPGAYVILCHIHPEMVAYVVVVPTRYYAAVEAEGHFAIEGIPPGDYLLHVWHWRSVDIVRQVRILAGQTTTLELELRPAARGLRLSEASP